MTKKSNSKIFLFWIIILFVTFLWWSLMPAHFWLPIPFKVTDPKNANFSSSTFRFEDYRTPEIAKNAMEKIFAKGTPQQEVDAFFLLQKNMHIGVNVTERNAGQSYSVYYFQKIKRATGFITGRYTLARFDPHRELEEFKYVGYTDNKANAAPWGFNIEWNPSIASSDATVKKVENK